MNILGDYQNDIPDLSELDLEHYERIFKIYTTENNGKMFYFYNILRRLSLPDNIDTSVLDTYAVKTDLPLTIISHNIYKELKLWWLIYLLNKKEIGNNIFLVPGGTQLKYIKQSFLEPVFSEITNLTIFNGRHF